MVLSPNRVTHDNLRVTEDKARAEGHEYRGGEYPRLVRLLREHRRDHASKTVDGKN